MATTKDILTVLIVAFTVPGSLLAEERVNCSNGPSRQVCQITQPTVTRRTTAYPQIRLHVGDRVGIQAGGCVQTGGHGATWKRYVNPEGPNSDRLYYGLVYLPGFSVDYDSDDELNGFRRISEVIGRYIEVSNPPCPPKADCVERQKGDQIGTLRLGYTDDDYHDNGYWGHDDGTGDQCRGVGPAWVTVTINLYQRPQPAVIGTATPNPNASPQSRLVRCRELAPDAPEQSDCSAIANDFSSRSALRDEAGSRPRGDEIRWTNDAGVLHVLVVESDVDEKSMSKLGRRKCRDIQITAFFPGRTVLAQGSVCQGPSGAWSITSF